MTIVGEPGIGKSRLGLEFTHWLELLREPVRFFQGRPQPYGNNVPYGLLRDLLAWRFEILESDSQSVAQAQARAGPRRRCSASARAEYTALIGAADRLRLQRRSAHRRRSRARPSRSATAPSTRSRRTSAPCSATAARRSCFCSTTCIGPTTARSTSSTISRRPARDLPLFILCLTRSTLFERRPLWGSGRSDHLRIDLAPLSKRGTRELIEALLGRLETVPTALRDLLASSAEGNPYFVEELIGMLIDDGVIVTDSEPWRVSADKLLDVRVPSTLAGVLQARIDSLPPAEKAALQQASVIGHVFWDEALQRIAPAASPRSTA